MRVPTCAPLVNSMDWELCWAPYDAQTYELALNQLSSNDIILEIGAGDLRLARQMAAIAHTVYALEINRAILDEGLASSAPLPGNLIPICADAQTFRFPRGVTSGVLLMRHCARFQLYAEKLRGCGCRRLITNARWGMSVEVVDLQTARAPFEKIEFGWYACWCGAVGFKQGPPEKITPKTESVIHETIGCPKCEQSRLLSMKIDTEWNV